MLYIFYHNKNTIKIRKKIKWQHNTSFQFSKLTTFKIFFNFVNDGTQCFWVWGNKDSHMLLVGVWITMVNYTPKSYKYSDFWYSDPTSRNTATKIIRNIENVLCPMMLITSLFIISNNLKQPMCPERGLFKCIAIYPFRGTWYWHDEQWCKSRALKLCCIFESSGEIL